MEFKHLMHLPHAQTDELELEVPDELTRWWWEEGWEEVRRPDGSVVWPGISCATTERSSLNPLLPDATSLGRLGCLSLAEWPAKAALAWTMWAASFAGPGYTELLGSARELWPKRKVIEHLLAGGFLPMPLINLAVLSRQSRKRLEALLPEDGKELRHLKEQAEVMYPRGRDIWWIGVELPRAIGDDETPDSRLLSPASDAIQFRILFQSDCVKLWVRSVLTRLFTGVQSHFSVNPTWRGVVLIHPDEASSDVLAATASIT